jgi:hypothetical protein
MHMRWPVISAAHFDFAVGQPAEQRHEGILCATIAQFKHSNRNESIHSVD